MNIVLKYCSECGDEYRLQLSGKKIEKSYATEDFCNSCGKLFYEMFQKFKSEVNHLFEPIWEKIESENVFDSLLEYFQQDYENRLKEAKNKNLFPPLKRIFASLYGEKGISRIELIKQRDKLYKLIWWEKNGIKSDKEVFILQRKNIKTNEIVGYWNINKLYKEN